MHICPSVEYIERAWDDAKYGKPSRNPLIEMTIPTMYDPSLAPEGRDQAVLLRLTQLWDRRLAAASPSADRGELVRFGEWFASGRFDDDWSLRQLARVITLTSDVKPDILVLRRLAEIAPARTQLCLDIVNDWVKRLPDGAWLLSAREDYLRRILQVGLANPDASTSALAGEIVNRAARRGQLRLQDSHYL